MWKILQDGTSVRDAGRKAIYSIEMPFTGSKGHLLDRKVLKKVFSGVVQFAGRLSIVMNSRIRVSDAPE